MPHRNRILHLLPNNHSRTSITPTAYTNPITFGPPLSRMRRPHSLTNNCPIFRPIAHIRPHPEQATRPSPGPSLHTPHLVIPRPPRRVGVCIRPSPGSIPVPVATAAAAEVRV